MVMKRLLALVAYCVVQHCIAIAQEGTVLLQGTEIKNYSAVAVDIVTLIQSQESLGPLFIRIAWHLSGTYSKKLQNGGSQGGTIRLQGELQRSSNKGIATAVTALESIYKKFKYTSLRLSHGDLYTLAGNVAIKLYGGPKITWKVGRKDTDAPAPDHRLPIPDAGSFHKTASGLRGTMGRMGFNDAEIVVLSGAHIIGSCHMNISGYQGKWSPTPFLFNKGFFELLLFMKWNPVTNSNNLTQYTNPSNTLMMLPSDLALVHDAKFLIHVTKYAFNQTIFFLDFAKAFQKLQELGTIKLRPAAW